MTEFQALLRAIEARGRAVAKEARAIRAAALIVATGELPGVAAATDGDDVVLTARGLRARSYGSRRRLPDAALQSLVRR